jgi:hypothetical protein
MKPFGSIAEALDVLVEEPTVVPDWQAIVDLAAVDSGQRRSSRRPRHRVAWRVPIVVAVVLVAVLAAAAFATGFADRFSAWISGKPGSPAPASLQRGFSSRNEASLAGFPAGTKLRLLMRSTVAATTFDLLGFRNGDAYCLRLVRADRPGSIGSNQCLRADELQGHAALVADDVWFRVGSPEISITGIYGFAADDVHSVRVTRAHGASVARVQNNVFLSLFAQPSGTVRNHPQPNPVEAIAAVMQGGTLRNIPYVIAGGGILPGGAKPTVPSYFAATSPHAIPGGPTKVTAPIEHPTVRWLAQRQKLGSPLPKARKRTLIPKLDFGRLIQPDPNDPLRVGVGVGPAQGMTHGHPIRGPWLCVLEFAPLTNSPGSEGCGPLLSATRPFALGPWLDTPITHFNGVVPDGIHRVVAFLANGRKVHAALRDNVFQVAVPQAELPGEIVAYDAHDRVAGIFPLQANAVAKPCPPAEFATPTSQLPAPAKWERIDLATLAVNGNTILGKTPDEVETLLGKPAAIRPNAQTVNGIGIPEFRYGGTSPSTLGLSITFVKRRSQILARSLYYQAPSLVDARLGHLLRLQPTVLQKELQHAYGSRYRLSARYGNSPFSVGQEPCTGTFHATTGTAGIEFGLNPHRPSRPYLIIHANEN